MSFDPECCAFCIDCERPFCRDQEPSPGEAEHICPRCWDERAVAS